jgi:DNA mismatch endonuclease, patch repair protein
MPDKLDPARRSWNMSRIRNRDTKPEILLRSLLHRAGFRFRKNDSRLPGSPDVVLPGYRTAVFVHGCFWHRHEACRNCTVPTNNREMWLRKFSQNQLRDRRNVAALQQDGWSVYVVWECEMPDGTAVKKLIRSLRRRRRINRLESSG